MSQDEILYTVPEVAKLLKTNQAYVYELIKAGHLKPLKLGRFKVRRNELMEFLERFQGYDLTNPFEVKKIGE